MSPDVYDSVGKGMNIAQRWTKEFCFLFDRVDYCFWWYMRLLHHVRQGVILLLCLFWMLNMTESNMCDVKFSRMGCGTLYSIHLAKLKLFPEFSSLPCSGQGWPQEKYS